MRFRMNGIYWIIKIEDYNSSVFIMPNGRRTIGVTDNNTKTIFIADYLRSDMLRKVLCHEFVHAAMFSYGIYMDLDTEEMVADLIATYGVEIESITDKIYKELY